MTSGFSSDACVALAVTVYVLLVSDYEGSGAWWIINVKPQLHGYLGSYTRISPYLWWYVSSLALYLGVPCAVSTVTRHPPLGSLGFGLGNVRVGLPISGAALGVMVAVAFAASRFPEFQQAYPLASEALESRHVFVAYELSYVAYFISWEFLFRGYLLQGLRPTLGNALANLVQTVPFALMHAGKPEAEAYGSVIAGLALGALALETGTFWYGALIHSAVAVAMDLFCGASRIAH